MGHPVNGIDYLLSEWDWLQRKNPFPFYVFFLFTKDNHYFADFFHNHFEELDQSSADACMFFAIAPPPPNWSHNARSREYWKHFLADSHREINYDTEAIKLAARYFSVPTEYLPALVIFRNIRDTDILTIRLCELNKEELYAFCHNLFALFHIENFQEFPLWKLQKIVDILPYNCMYTDEKIRRWVTPLYQTLGQARLIPRTFVGKDLEAHNITYRTELPQTLEATLASLQHEIQLLTRRMDEQFERVHIQLEQIQSILKKTNSHIDEFRENFIVKWANINGKTFDLDTIREKQENLHIEFDQFLEQQSQHLTKQLSERFAARPSPQQLPEELQNMYHFLEERTRIELITAEFLWNYLADVEISSLDFSVCGIGLWKSLEIELNRTFIDALRVLHQLCDTGQPSVEQVVKTSTGRIEEPGLFYSKRGSVTIFDPRKGIKSGVELGGVGGLLAYSHNAYSGSENNNLSDIISGVDPTLHDFLNPLSTQIHTVTQTYRNTYSHIFSMNRSVFEQFREFFLDIKQPDNPLLTTLRYKEKFVKSGLI